MAGRAAGSLPRSAASGCRDPAGGPALGARTQAAAAAGPGAAEALSAAGDGGPGEALPESPAEAARVTTRIEAGHFVNSMGLAELVGAIEPAPPEAVVAAAGRLKYRDFLIVTLVLDRPDPFPDNWIYVHSSEVSVGRIQNFRAWSKDMLPNDHQASIGMEYFCQEGDGLWAMDTPALIAQAASELERLGLARACEVVDGTVIRQPKAYPVYDTEYREAVDTISAWLRTLENLQSVGRNGLHRYNNQDHSMLTAILAARNVADARARAAAGRPPAESPPHDLWTVNVERAYHEEFQRPDPERDPEPQRPNLAAE